MIRTLSRLAPLAAMSVAATVVAARAAEQPIRVAPHGSGTACSATHPCSLLTARAVVRARAPGMSGDLHIVLAPGTYRLTSTFVLSGADSGRNGFRVIYEAAGEGDVRVSGGIIITDYKVANGLLTARLPEASEFRQIYVNGARTQRARWPNTGYETGLDWNEAAMTTSFPATPPTIDDPSAVELVVNRHWQQHRLRLDGPLQRIDGRTTASFQADDAYISFNAAGETLGAGQPFFLENARAFLDAPGEWYFDRHSRTLEYLLRPNERITSVELPMVETLVRLQGTDKEPVHHISFRGITFEYAGWIAPSRGGMVPVQATWLSTLDGARFTPGAVEVRSVGAHDLAFEHNVFRHLGSSGLALFTGVKDSSIVGNAMYDVAANGITVDSDPSRTDFTGPGSQRITIADNVIHDIGTDYDSSIGIFAGFLGNSVIERNHIYNTPYTGISVGWGWTDRDTPARNNRIQHNHIHDVLQVHDDGGAIYLLSKQPGTFISHNYIHKVLRSKFAGESAVAGIYLDNGAQGVTVEDNVIENVDMLFFQNLGNDPSKGILPAKGNIIKPEVANRAAIIAAARPRLP